MKHEARDTPPDSDVETELPEDILNESDGSQSLAPDQGKSAANQGTSEQSGPPGAAMTPDRQGVDLLTTSTSGSAANAETTTPAGSSGNPMPTENSLASKNPMKTRSMNKAAAPSGQIPSTLAPTDLRPTRSLSNNTTGLLPPSSAQATSSALGISERFRQARAVLRNPYYLMLYGVLRNNYRQERPNITRAVVHTVAAAHTPSVINPWTGCPYCVNGCGYCTFSNVHNTSAHQDPVMDSIQIGDILTVRIPMQSIGGNRSYLAILSSGSYNPDSTYHHYLTDVSNQRVHNAYENESWNVQYSTHNTAAQFSGNNGGYHPPEQAQPAALILENPGVQENIQQPLAYQEIWRRDYNTPMEPPNLGSANLVPLFTTRSPNLISSGCGWVFSRAIPNPQWSTTAGSTHLIGRLPAAQRNPDATPEGVQRVAEYSQKTVNARSTSGGNGQEGNRTKANQGQRYTTVLQESQVPLGLTLHVCTKCMVFFISAHCTYRFVDQPPTYAFLCPCISLHAGCSYLQVNPPGDPSQTERHYRLNAFTALIQSPSRAEDWLRQWGPYLRSTGGLTTGHCCDDMTSGGMK